MHFATFVVDAALDSALAATCYVGLSTTTPADDASSGVTEPVGGSYARVALLGANWTAASGRQKESAVDVTFPVATADWGTVTHYVLFTALTGGLAMAPGRVGVGKTIITGAQAVLPAGSIHAEAP